MLRFLNSLETQPSVFQASFGETWKFGRDNGELMSKAGFPQGHPIVLSEKSFSTGIIGNAWGPVTASCRQVQVKRSRPRHGSVSGTLRGETCMVLVRGYIRDTKRAADHRLGSDPSTAV